MLETPAPPPPPAVPAAELQRALDSVDEWLGQPDGGLDPLLGLLGGGTSPLRGFTDGAQQQQQQQQQQQGGARTTASSSGPQPAGGGARTRERARALDAAEGSVAAAADLALHLFQLEVRWEVVNVQLRCGNVQFAGSSKDSGCSPLTHPRSHPVPPSAARRGSAPGPGGAAGPAGAGGARRRRHCKGGRSGGRGKQKRWHRRRHGGAVPAPHVHPPLLQPAGYT